MKTNILIITAILIMSNSISYAQIKIHDDNHVSLGSLTKAGGFQMQPEGYIYTTNRPIQLLGPGTAILMHLTHIQK